MGVQHLKKEYDINHIVKLNGVYVKEISDEIVNGEVFQMFGDMKLPLGKMKDGKNEGKWISWYPNGQKREEVTYKDGKKDGFWKYWNENGQIESAEKYNNGKLRQIICFY